MKESQAHLPTAFEELREHISKEEDGPFPASLTALDGDDWNASKAAWQEAHPGEHLLRDWGRPRSAPEAHSPPAVRSELSPERRSREATHSKEERQ